MKGEIFNLLVVAAIFLISALNNKMKKKNEEINKNPEEINSRLKKDMPKKVNKTKNAKNILESFLNELDDEEKPKNKSTFLEDLYKSFSSDEGKREVIEKNISKKEKEIKKTLAENEYEIKKAAEIIEDKKEKDILTADELKEEIKREREIYKNSSFDYDFKINEDKKIDFDFKDELDSKSLARAIILSEIIDKPISLRDE